MDNRRRLITRQEDTHALPDDEDARVCTLFPLSLSSTSASLLSSLSLALSSFRALLDDDDDDDGCLPATTERERSGAALPAAATAAFDLAAERAHTARTHFTYVCVYVCT